MDRAREQVEAAGARLVLIGQATPRQAANFRKRQKLTLPVLADKERASYKAAGAKIATRSELLGPKVIAKGAAATAQTGQLQTRPIGHTAQLGGALLIMPGGEVTWSHMSEDASDNASADEILKAVRAL